MQRIASGGRGHAVELTWTNADDDDDGDDDKEFDDDHDDHDADDARTNLEKNSVTCSLVQSANHHNHYYKSPDADDNHDASDGATNLEQKN